MPPPGHVSFTEMSASRIWALLYLAYRACVAHPLKRLRQKGSGRERFFDAYGREGLPPTGQEEREIGDSASACISCGLCEVACDLGRSAPSERALGLHAAFRLYSKSAAALRSASVILESHSTCALSVVLCPVGIPIGRILTQLRLRASGSSTPPKPIPSMDAVGVR